MTIKQHKEAIQKALDTNDAAVVKALRLLFEKQTADEQASHETRWRNGCGFSGVDAEILTSFARQVERWDVTAPSARRFAFPLSPKQLALARRKLRKYWRQLLPYARERAAELADQHVDCRAAYEAERPMNLC